MTYNEAIETAKNGELKIIVSKSIKKFLCLVDSWEVKECTSDWPIRFTPTEQDLSATDYKVIDACCWPDDI